MDGRTLTRARQTELRDQALGMLNSGKTIQEVVDATGLRYSTIHGYHYRFGSRKPAGGKGLMKLPKPRSMRILRDLWEGMSSRNTAIKYGVSVSEVNALKARAIDCGWVELNR